MILLIFIMVFQLVMPLIINELHIKERYKKIIITTVSFLLLFFLSAFRGIEVANDTRNYYSFFDKLEPWSFPNTHFETGYVIFNNIIKIIFKHPQAIIIITSFINLYLVFKFFIKESKIIWLTIFLFITSRLYFTNVSAIRQSMALGLILISYNYFKTNKNFMFLFFVLLASTFHISALFFLIIYITKFFDVNKKSLFITLLLSSLIIMIPTSLLFKIPYYSSYFGSLHDNANRPAAILGSIMSLLILIFSLLYTSVSQKKDNLLIKISMIAFLVSLFGVKSSVAGRMYYYFEIFNIVLITNVIYNIKNKSEKLLWLILIIVLFSSYYFITFYFRPEWMRFVPYEFFWQK